MLGSSSIKSRIFLGSFHVKVASTLHSVVGNFKETRNQKSVVYQKTKLSAETESFQLSAFGFGRRN